MLNAERRQVILEILKREGRVLASELSLNLNVSEDTIRRDLREMGEAGLIQRVHGGALPLSPEISPFTTRQENISQAKIRIGKVAAALIKDGQIVLLDGGTTALEVARHLPSNLKATIVTNSPPVAIALAQHPTIELIMLGGQLYKESLVTVGPATLEALNMIRADLYLLGICSLHRHIGISTPELQEAYIKRAMIACSSEVVALASAEKLGTTSSYVVGPITELTHIVTEKNLNEEILAPYRSLDITIIEA
jgi:DeoR/GlpR family transcriptional regulator of sugar metabolism